MNIIRWSNPVARGGGTSYSLTLPIETIRAFNWKEKQKLKIEIDRKNKRLIIRDWKK